MRKDAIISMRNAATVLLACAIVLLCFAWRSPAYASGLGSIELSCGAEHAGEHVALAGDGYALTKVASAEVDGASASVAYVTEEAFSGVDRNWAALDGAGLRAAGKAVFSSLEPGLYLISRFEVAPANAEFSCDPALVSVPATIDGVLTYAVEVTPKFEHEPLTPGPGPGEDGKPADPLDQLADKVAGALGFAKTSDGMFALACAAVLCAFAAVVLLLWRRRAVASAGAHAAGSKRFDSSAASASDASVAAKRAEAFAADRGSDSESHTKA